MYGPGFTDDLHGFYRRTRAEHGDVAPALLAGDIPVWLVTSYREILHILRNPALFARSSYRWNQWPNIPGDWELMFPLIRIPTVLHVEGAEHERRAGAITDVMENVDHVELARLCERVADRVIGSFAADGEADLIAQYAQPLALGIMARLMGVPAERVRSLADDFILVSTAHSENTEAGLRCLETLTGIAAEDRRAPAGGLITEMARHPAGLTDSELVLDLLVFLGAGALSAGSLIGSALRLMLVDDELSLSLSPDGGRISVEQALTEVLWRDPPMHNVVGRWPVRDVELGGRLIREGDALCLGLAGANQEARAAAGTGPGANRAHLAFGHGEHSCPVGGAAIGEVIARAGVEILLDRLPDIRLSGPAASLRWRESSWMRTLRSLPVAFDPVLPGNP